MANEQEITTDDLQGDEQVQPTTQTELNNDYDLQKICQLCENLVLSVSDNKTGISQTDIDNLQEKKQIFASLDKYHLSKGKIGKNFSRANEKMAEESGLKDSLTPNETKISLNLTKALIASFKYINTIDKDAYLENNKMAGDLDCAINANREFANFFIQTDKILHCGEGIATLFYKIFSIPDFYRKFTSAGLNRFPSGIFAMIYSYLHIQKIMSDGSLTVSSIEQDRDSAIDLVWSKDGEEKRVFEVKGSQNVNEITLLNLNNQNDLETLRKLNSTFDSQTEKSRNISLKNLLTYAKSHKGVEPYWIEIPTK